MKKWDLQILLWQRIWRNAYERQSRFPRLEILFFCHPPVPAGTCTIVSNKEVNILSSVSADWSNKVINPEGKDGKEANNKKGNNKKTNNKKGNNRKANNKKEESTEKEGSGFHPYCFNDSSRYIWNNNGVSVSYTHLRAHETRHDLVC